MDADIKGMEQIEIETPAENEVSPENELLRAQDYAADGEDIGETEEDMPRVAHSLIDVLFPASPPAVPKTARVIRRFDLEAAQFDPRPAAETPAATPEKKEPSQSREEARALRNRSLRAAAGFF